MSRARGRWLGVLYACAAVALGLALVRAFFFGLYRVGSESMEPSIHGGNGAAEWVLVRYAERPELARFDLVVVRRSGSEAPIVKRVVGLPGERVQLVGGDVLIDGERIAPSAARPAPIVVFDSERDSLGDAFRHTDDGTWTPGEDGAWRLDASAVERGHDAGLMLLNPDLQDAYPAADGSLHSGEQQVNDGVLELDARVDGGEGRLVLRLVEAGDTFEVALEPLSPGGGEEARAHAVLTRRTGTDSVATAAEAGLAFARGTWHRLRFANVDNHVSFAIDGRVVLAFDYEANVPWLGHDQAGTHTGALLRSIGPRVAFGAEGLTASFRDVRVARDLFWVPEGLRAVDEPFELGPDEYFVLGDNSAHSNDGRHFGPARASQVLGRPVAVLWPPRAIRRLRGPEPPASEPRP